MSKRVSIYLSTSNLKKLTTYFGADMNLSQALNQVVAEWQPNGTHAILKNKCPECGGSLRAVVATGHVFCTGGHFKSGMPCDFETTISKLNIEKE